MKCYSEIAAKELFEHRSKINGIMLDVGAVFYYHTSTICRAPIWMQNNGLEWLQPLTAGPKRLWKDHFLTSPFFIIAVKAQLLSLKI